MSGRERSTVSKEVFRNVTLSAVGKAFGVHVMASRCALPAAVMVGLGAACALLVPGVRADEAFLCGPDTVVYVKHEDLEHKKRTDPCIARYFGLNAESTPLPHEGNPVADQTSTATEKSKRKDIALKSLQTPETAERVSPPALERSAALSPPVAAPGTDYRNVKVLNASSPADEWFKHTR